MDRYLRPNIVRKHRHPLRCLFHLTLAVFAIGSGSGADISGSKVLIDPAKVDLKRGEKLSRQVCVACHIWPSPDLLPQSTWAQNILPWMMYYVGLKSVESENNPYGPSAKLIAEKGLLPEKPLINEDDWQQIVAFYLLKSSPHNYPGPIIPLAAQPEHFRVRFVNFTDPGPMTSLVKIDESSRSVIFGTDTLKRINVFDSNGTSRRQIPVGTPVHLSAVDGGWLATDIGSYLPTEFATGRILMIPANGDPPFPLLERLQRPVQAQSADFNGDGRMDLIVSQFGWVGGRFSWFEQLPDASYREHPLIEKPGSAHAEIRDLNGDGQPDIALLVAQATEAVLFFLNNGRGGFEMRTAVQGPPSYGLSWFEMGDYDNDGSLDLLTVNGDMDYAGAARPYHGIRLYRGAADLTFKELFHIELPGAYKAAARDFDRDGDLDIFAIAFNPQLPSRADLGIVYFENTGRFDFTSRRMNIARNSRWITMDVGDVDRDGDIDIALGGSWMGPGYNDVITPQLQLTWANFPVASCLIENTSADGSDQQPAATRFGPVWQDAAR